MSANAVPHDAALVRGAWGRSIRLVVALPILIVLGAIEWFVPASSPYAPGHAIGISLIGAWAFLLIWFCWALVNGGLALAGARARSGVAFRNDMRVIQWCLIAIALLGGIPLLTFDLAPDASSAVLGIVTSTLFPALVVALSLTQTVLVAQANRTGDRNAPR